MSSVSCVLRIHHEEFLVLLKAGILAAVREALPSCIWVLQPSAMWHPHARVWSDVRWWKNHVLECRNSPFYTVTLNYTVKLRVTWRLMREFDAAEPPSASVDAVKGESYSPAKYTTGSDFNSSINFCISSVQNVLWIFVFADGQSNHSLSSV